MALWLCGSVAHLSMFLTLILLSISRGSVSESESSAAWRREKSRSFLKGTLMRKARIALVLVVVEQHTAAL